MLPTIRWFAGAVVFASALFAQDTVFDQTFVPQPNGPVLALEYDAEGRLLVGGSFSRISNVSRTNLARLEVTGVADPTFDPVFSGGPVYAIARQSTGKIIVGGSFRTVDGQAVPLLARLNGDGSVDTTFSAPIVGSIVRTVVVLPDDRLVIGGSFASISNQPRFGLARLHVNGSLDATFLADLDDVPSVSGSRVVATVARQADGRIIFGGQFGSVNGGHVRRGLARVTADGVIDAGFNPADGTPSITSVAVQRDGRILVSGSIFSLGGVARSHIGRLNADGSVDMGFAPFATNTVFVVREQSDGRVLAGGHFTSMGGLPRSYLARLLASGALDSSFTVEASGPTVSTGPGVQAIAISASGHITIGGSFTSVAGATRSNLARLVPAAPQIIVTESTIVVGLGENRAISALVLGAGGTYQWRKDGQVLAGSPFVGSLSLTGMRPEDAGTYTLTVTNAYGTATSSPITVIAGVRPQFTREPTSVAAVAGQGATFTAAATGNPTPGYQWRKNGVTIVGATNASYTIPVVDASHAGEYAVIAFNAAGGTTSSAATLTVLPAARLGNVSVRTMLGSGQSLIVGFVVGGGSTTEVLVRAAGPALGQFGVGNAMADPRLELYRDSTKLVENDSWPSVLAESVGRVGAFPFETNSRDAGLMQAVTGPHSAVASGTGAGVVLVEAYDAGAGVGARLVNVSARNQVGTDGDILIAGISVAGSGTMRVLIRAVGPTLGLPPFGLPGVLADPKLEVYSAAGVKLAENDNWEPGLGATFDAVGTFRLGAGSRDAALVLELTGGQNYTAQVSGVGRTTGVALVEVFEIPR